MPFQQELCRTSLAVAHYHGVGFRVVVSSFGSSSRTCIVEHLRHLYNDSAFSCSPMESYSPARLFRTIAVSVYSKRRAFFLIARQRLYKISAFSYLPVFLCRSASSLKLLPFLNHPALGQFHESPKSFQLWGWLVRIFPGCSFQMPVFLAYRSRPTLAPLK